MTRKQKKDYAAQLLSLQRKILSAKKQDEARIYEITIENLTAQILEEGGSIEDLIAIDEMVQKKI